MHSNKEFDIFINLPSGKLSKDGSRKPIKKQKRMACVLYAMRRISFFEQNAIDAQQYKAYIEIKKALTNYADGYEKLCEIAASLCRDNNINVYNVLKFNDAFNYNYLNRLKKDTTENQFFDDLNPRVKWGILYEILMERVLLPLMHIKNINWHPRDGFSALAKSLNEHGAHAFIGKFGSCCHAEKSVLPSKETSEMRKVFYFKKDTYKGDSVPFAHCVIVDQVKVINGKEMVFFRDPMFSSDINKPEKIFMLSHESFVQRLVDWDGRRLIHGQCSDSVTFGRASTNPEKFGHHPLQITAKK